MLVDRFVFSSGTKRYVVNFTPIIVKNYNPHRGKKEAVRRGWAAIIRAKDTGTPYSGVALIAPTERKDKINISDAKMLALHKAIASMVASTIKRGNESSLRLKIHDLYADAQLNFVFAQDQFCQKYWILETARQRELNARKNAIMNGKLKGKLTVTTTNNPNMVYVDFRQN